MSGAHRKHWELESLCDLGAAELLLPRTTFSRDFEARGISVSAIVDLADLYAASVEATLIRAVTLGKGSFAIAVLSEKLKPTEQRVAQTPTFPFMDAIKPKLRVDYTSVTEDFDIFIPKDKSAPEDSVAYRALEESGVHGNEESWDVPGFGKRRVEAVALPKVNDVNRVGLMLFPQF